MANREIPAGSLVLVEKPFVSCLDVEKEEDHCHHCLNNCPLRQVICINNDKIKLIGVLQDTARATTTSQPTNRAPNEPAMDRNANFGLNLVVFGQKILFLLEKSKVLLPT